MDFQFLYTGPIQSGVSVPVSRFEAYPHSKSRQEYPLDHVLGISQYTSPIGGNNPTNRRCPPAVPDSMHGDARGKFLKRERIREVGLKPCDSTVLRIIDRYLALPFSRFSHMITSLEVMLQAGRRNAPIYFPGVVVLADDGVDIHRIILTRMLPPRSSSLLMLICENKIKRFAIPSLAKGLQREARYASMKRGVMCELVLLSPSRAYIRRTITCLSPVLECWAWHSDVDGLCHTAVVMPIYTCNPICRGDSEVQL